MNNIYKGTLLILLTECLTCCGVKASGTTTHRVEGEATVRIVVDVSICDSLEGADKIECIKAIVKILEEANSKETANKEIGGI